MADVEGKQNILYADYCTGLSLAQVAEKHNVHLNTVFHLFKRHKLPARTYSQAQTKYEFDQYAFDVLTTQGAYWLGFIYADGYLDEKRNILRIILHEKDVIILEEFKIFLNSNHPIHHYRKKRNIVSIQLVGNHFTRSLKRLGVFGKKTHTIQFPYFIPKEFYSDFIRGYFDGDGSIGVNVKGTKQPVFRITSNPIMISQIQKILMAEVGLRQTSLQKYVGKTSLTLKYGGKYQVAKILKYLTRNDGFYLPRKIGRWLPSLT
jgi:intein/homing endonuclease